MKKMTIEENVLNVLSLEMSFKKFDTRRNSKSENPIGKYWAYGKIVNGKWVVKIKVGEKIVNARGKRIRKNLSNISNFTKTVLF